MASPNINLVNVNEDNDMAVDVVEDNVTENDSAFIDESGYLADVEDNVVHDDDHDDDDDSSVRHIFRGTMHGSS